MENELFEAEFTTRGAGLLRWRLQAYDDASRPERPSIEITTLRDLDAELALATPLEDLGFGDLTHAPYSVDQPDPNTLSFELERGGITVRKSYYLDPDSYAFRLRIEIENESDRHVRPTFRVQWPVSAREGPDFRELALAALADGSLEQAQLAGGASFLGLFGGGLEAPKEYPAAVDWAGANTRYFLAAVVPDVPREAAARFVPLGVGHGVTEVAFRGVNVPPLQRTAREFRVYLGPKETARLERVGAHLDESILKGWFPALTSFFTWMLTATHRIVPNYGVAIILITILVRLLMAPIMAKQMKSMKRMGTLAPKVKELQAKYADDKQKQSEEMMKLYRESGFNPLAGCLPMLLQLPVFIGFYYALQGSILLRQVPFVGWIDDLSAPETLFVIPGLELPVRLLPLLMGGSMVIQTRMTPSTMDPAQARMMNTVMPVMFTFIFYQFASGLVLYWFVSNLLGIAQQVWTNRSKDD